MLLMNARNPKEKLDWHRIAITAVVVSAVLVVAIGASVLPLVRKALADREAQRVKAMYATGLAICVDRPSDIDRLLQRYLPATPTVSINVMPSFSSLVAIRLVGQELFYFVLDFPLYKTGENQIPRFNSNGVPTIYHSRVSSEIARQLPLVLANDIKHAQLESPQGLDGTTYYFRASPKSCAMTWSPGPNTRADHFVELFNQLAQRAKTSNASDVAASEQAILATIKSLQSN